jgi:protein TonB
VLKQDITGLLAENKRVRKGHYTLMLNLWIGPDGQVQRFELANSTGSADLDRSLKVALAGLDRVREAPPGDMPQPVKLRITSRL